MTANRIQALNYTPKAIECLLTMPCSGSPGTMAGLKYLGDKLREAEVFVLSDNGQLLDRGKPRPEVAGAIFHPPFPVVALEYSVSTQQWAEGHYSSSKCPRRISLAWDWQDDLPEVLKAWCPHQLGPGVVIASIPFYDEHQRWVPVPAAMHMSYDEEWRSTRPNSPFLDAMVKSGRLSKAQLGAATVPMSAVPLLPEALLGIAAVTGQAGMIETLSADTMDEVNAYTDLCYALACKNVHTHKLPAPEALNRQRVKARKLPLKSFHVLEISGATDLPGASVGGDRNAPRSHLRRGHIRRIGQGRVTWVNSTVVRGRGFVDKVYAL